jgi:hypothetical protein
MEQSCRVRMSRRLQSESLRSRSNKTAAASLQMPPSTVWSTSTCMAALKTPSSHPHFSQSNQAEYTLSWEIRRTVSTSPSSTCYQIFTMLIFLHLTRGFPDFSPAMLHCPHRRGICFEYPTMDPQCLSPSCISPSIKPTGTFTLTDTFCVIPSSMGIPWIPPYCWTRTCDSISF